MWRLANYIYRAFRGVATHRCSQDIIVPIATVYNRDDESTTEKKEDILSKFKSNLHNIIQNNQSSTKNIEKLEKNLIQIALQHLVQKPHVIKAIEAPQIKSIVQEVQSLPSPSKPSSQPQPSSTSYAATAAATQKEETLDSLLQADENCMKILKSLSELNEETMSTINNQLAIEAIETGNLQLGIETLQSNAKDGKNAAALYNLGICYERGIGVEEDRAKACDYYRQASALGHINAQFNLTLLSNHIDINDNDEEIIEETITNKPRIFNFSFSKDYKQDQSQSIWTEYQLNLTKTLTCLT